MRISALAVSTVGVIAVTATFAGCGGGGSPSQLVPLASTQSSQTQAARDRSWMDPLATRNALVYVSDQGPQKDVEVFSYGAGQLVGTLTGFTTPAGLCSDKAGNVYITDGGSAQIFEYAHGGTSPINTLSDPFGYPDGCSVDPTTGNLAVATYIGFSYAPGGVSIYANGTGPPTEYADLNFSYFFFVGYDNQGNLFVDGRNINTGFQFAELPKGGSALTDITLSQAPGFPGAVQWDGKYVDVGDLSGNHIDQYTVSGSSGTLQGTMSLSGVTAVIQFWLPKFGNGKVNPQVKNVVGADSGGSSGIGQVLYWNYPAGGTPTKTITNGLGAPFGVTVSSLRQR
jgi:hypothetical protein